MSGRKLNAALADEAGHVELNNALRDYALLLFASFLRMFRPVVPAIVLRHYMVAQFAQSALPALSSVARKGQRAREGCRAGLARAGKGYPIIIFTYVKVAKYSAWGYGGHS